MSWRPHLAAGARRILLARLVANGLAQTALAVGIALLMTRMLGLLAGAGPTTALEETAAALAGAGVGTAALRALQRRDAEALGLSYVRDVQMRVFSHLCRLPADRLRIGTTMTRFTTDLSSVKNWISHGVASALVAAAALSAGTAALAFLDWRLALASLVPFVLCGGIAAAVSVPLTRAVRTSRRLRGRLAGRIGDDITVRTTLFHLGLVEREARRLAESAAELDAVLVRRALLAGGLRFSVDAIAPCAAALILVLHALGAGTPLHAASVASWLFALTVILGPVRDCARAWDYRLAFSEAFRRLDRLFAGAPAPSAALSAKHPFPAGSGLKLDGVKLSARPQSLDFEANADSFVAVLGEPSVRSELFGVIAGLNRPGAGALTFGGVPLSSLLPRHYSRVVGLASPALPLVHGSLRRNLARGMEPVDDEDLLAVLRHCRLDGLFPEGLDTRLGAGANGIAPAVRARLMLARALIRDPRILLIDDPLLPADRDGHAVLSSIAAARGRILLVALEEADMLGAPDTVWKLPHNPRMRVVEDPAPELALED